MGGLNDSSKTRVYPVFSKLERRTDDWVRALLDLTAQRDSETREPRPWAQLDLHADQVDFAEPVPPADGSKKRQERAFGASGDLLKWLIRNLGSRVPKTLSRDAAIHAKRERLLARDQHVREEALADLARGGTAARWCTFEGPTYPDAVIETPAAVIVVEGKFTESDITTHTTWMEGRHQMLRHMDGAWEKVHATKRVFGLFAVEGDKSNPLSPGGKWSSAGERTRASTARATSLPHRNEKDQREIVAGFVGVVTWQAIVLEFGLPNTLLSTRV